MRPRPFRRLSSPAPLGAESPSGAFFFGPTFSTCGVNWSFNPYIVVHPAAYPDKEKTVSQEFASPQRRAPSSVLQQAAKFAVVPWVAVWGWVALDSALAYRKSRQAIDTAIEADPIAELYDGPVQPSGSIQRWLFWSPGSLDKLRALRRRARALMIGAPLIAVAGSTVLLALAGRRSRA